MRNVFYLVMSEFEYEFCQQCNGFLALFGDKQDSWIESQYNENLIELACSVRPAKMLAPFLFSTFMDFRGLSGSVHKLATKGTRPIFS